MTLVHYPIRSVDWGFLPLPQPAEVGRKMRIVRILPAAGIGVYKSVLLIDSMLQTSER